MRAVVMERYGSPDVLRSGVWPDPPETPGWVVVELRASALNWHDVLVRQGRYGSPSPHVIGADGAGVRVDTGQHVMVVPSLWWGADQRSPGLDWQILGDRVPGTYAERVRVPVECVVPKPPGWTWEEAAALPLVGLTVYRALVRRAELRPGDSLLVLGAGGGVSTMAVSMAGAIGAMAVVTSSSQARIDRARALGAIGGVCRSANDWPEAARALSPDGSGFDVVLDAVGTWSEALRALRPGGRLVVLGASTHEVADVRIRDLYFSHHTILGTTMGSAADMGGLADLVAAGRLGPPVIDRVFALEDAAAAHAHLERARHFGKVVLAHG